MSRQSRLLGGALALSGLMAFTGCTVPDSIYARLLGDEIEFVLCESELAAAVLVRLSSPELTGGDPDIWELRGQPITIPSGTVITTGQLVEGFDEIQTLENPPGVSDYLRVTLVVGLVSPEGSLQAGQVGTFTRADLSEGSWTGPGGRQTSDPC
jgi:hypothetical protein